MRVAILLAALLLGACAHNKPELAGTDTPHYTKPMKRAQPILPAPETKPATFKHRWFDRFMRHKTK